MKVQIDNDGKTINNTDILFMTILMVVLVLYMSKRPSGGVVFKKKVVVCVCITTYERSENCALDGYLFTLDFNVVMFRDMKTRAHSAIGRS